MNQIGLAQLLFFFLLLLVITKPLGAYMARVFEGRRTWLSPLLLPLENLIYKLAGIREREQRWTQYAAACLAFGLWNFLLFYILQRWQTFETLEGGAQMIPGGPVASQESIKLLSSDGGGFFNASSAHPFENPTPFTNFLEMLLILAIPAGLTHTFGRMVRDRRQGWALFFVMFSLLAAGSIIAYSMEQRGNPLLGQQGVDPSASATNPGGNFEGKEVRFGIAGSALFSVVSTATSSGAVNSMHDSYTPLSGLVQMFNMKCGEVIFGGPGSGLYGMLLITLVAVFVGGLMVGRTPEYLGKKIMAREMKMVMLAMIACSACILLMAAASTLMGFRPASYLNPPGAPTANLANRGPHGFSEILYAYASATGNNGSSFAGLNANTPWYNLTLGLAMLAGRFLIIIPVLAIAGSLALKPKTPVTSGTMPTHDLQFSLLLVGTIIIVAALTFLPAFAVGPIVEHFLMNAGRTFAAAVLL